jgi:hypothetical protein
MGRSLTVIKDVTVEIEFEDVMDYIIDYATDSEIAEIREEVGNIDSSIFDTGIDGSYVREEKMLLLARAANKYTLEELEQRLGNKFDLI